MHIHLGNHLCLEDAQGNLDLAIVPLDLMSNKVPYGVHYSAIGNGSLGRATPVPLVFYLHSNV